MELEHMVNTQNDNHLFSKSQIWDLLVTWFDDADSNKIETIMMERHGRSRDRSKSPSWPGMRVRSNLRQEEKREVRKQIWDDALFSFTEFINAVLVF